MSDSLVEYQVALRLQPDFVDAHYNPGVALSKDPSRRADASAEFEAALRIDPGFDPARAMLARLKTSGAEGPAQGRKRAPPGS